MAGGEGAGALPRAGRSSREQEWAAVAERAGEGTGRRLWVAAGALALSTVLAVLLFHGAWFSASPRMVGLATDPPIFAWYLRWAPFALQHGLDPLFTDYIHVPHGANLMSNTSILVPAVVMAPVTLLLGPVTAYNILSTAAVALSAWCAFLALRRCTRSVLGAGLGAALYGFGPYEVAQARGHPNLSIALFPPLLLLIADEMLVRQRRSRLALGAVLGLTVTAQLLISGELLLATAIAAAVGTLILALLNPRLVRERAPHALTVLGVAAAVAVPLCACPLWWLLLGPEHVSGLLQGRGAFVSDLVAFVRPGQTAQIGFPPRAPQLDSEAYVGVPLLALALVAVVALRRRRPAVLAAGLLAVAMAVLSMGPRLRIDGTVTGVHLPWRLVDHLPLVENVLPIRLMVFSYLMLGVIVAVTVGCLVASPRRWVRLLGPVAVAATLVPLLPLLDFPSLADDTPAFFTSTDLRRVPWGSTALVTPIYGEVTMLWQAEAGLRFRMPEGGAFRPGPAYNTAPSPLVTALSAIQQGDRPPPASLTPQERAGDLRTLEEAHVSSVLVGPPGRDALVRFLTLLLGRPPDATSGGVTMWLGLRP
jgi:hypothetical protein